MSLDGVEIAYEADGAGTARVPVVVLVHRWAGNRSYWADQIDALTHDEIGAERVVPVGHPVGGDAIVDAARDLGDRVVGLVWLDTFRSLGA